VVSWLNVRERPRKRALHERGLGDLGRELRIGDTRSIAIQLEMGYRKLPGIEALEVERGDRHDEDGSPTWNSSGIASTAGSRRTSAPMMRDSRMLPTLSLTGSSQSTHFSWTRRH
jgi:hypothetical protein